MPGVQNNAIKIANNLGAKTVISPVKVDCWPNECGTEKLWNSILFCTCR
jgi:hypothetical protein